ncbi:MAG: hypothetical protein GY849_19670 [Deltaproteobacteria bacterium]|nr:hypothetical protein [Deltaproteobacteria bacterium]
MIQDIPFFRKAIDGMGAEVASNIERFNSITGEAMPEKGGGRRIFP